MKNRSLTNNGFLYAEQADSNFVHRSLNGSKNLCLILYVDVLFNLSFWPIWRNLRSVLVQFCSLQSSPFTFATFEQLVVYLVIRKHYMEIVLKKILFTTGLYCHLKCII